MEVLYSIVCQRPPTVTHPALLTWRMPGSQHSLKLWRPWLDRGERRQRFRARRRLTEDRAVDFPAMQPHLPAPEKIADHAGPQEPDHGQARIR